jgi:hypothetical protein
MNNSGRKRISTVRVPSTPATILETKTPDGPE